MEFNNNDPKNIIGMSSLMTDDTAYNILELEKEIISGIDFSKEEENDTKQFKRDMERLHKSFNFETDDMYFDTDTGAPESIMTFDTYEPEPSYTSSPPSAPTPSYTSTPASYTSRVEPNWSRQSIEDNQLVYTTIEQKKQDYVNDVLQDIDNDIDFDIDKEKEDYDKNFIIEQIDALRSSLEEDGVDLDNVPRVTKDNSLNDIQAVFRVLTLKNDRNRYCSFAEEIILSGAYGLEYLFDGEKEWFGRKPDLVGWSQTVKVKLRRMKYTTSTFVQEVMQEYNFNAGTRLMLELLPSMFLYSRQKKLTRSDNNRDSRFGDAISNLNSQMSS